MARRCNLDAEEWKLAVDRRDREFEFYAEVQYCNCPWLPPPYTPTNENFHVCLHIYRCMYVVVVVVVVVKVQGMMTAPPLLLGLPAVITGVC